MRMYELWKITERDEPAPLADAGGPLLFERECDAREFCQGRLEDRNASYAIVPVRVGRA